MNVEKPSRTLVVIRTAIVCMTMFMFPACFVYAQDFDAVERRLGGAVEAGELSLEQAALMMQTLRRSMHAGQEVKAKKHRYLLFTNEIKAAVNAGKLSEEEAEQKLKAVRQEMFEQGDSVGVKERELKAKKRRYEEVAREVKEAHEAGRISEEVAEEKLIHLRNEMFEMEHRAEAESAELKAKKRRYEEVAREVKEAHEAGRISEEVAEEKLIHLRNEMFEMEHRAEAESAELKAKKRRYEEVTREVKEAHEAGRISEEVAEEKLIHLRNEMFQEKSTGTKNLRDLEAKKREYKKAAQRIISAVKAGDISEADAKERMIEMRKSIFKDRRR